MDQYTAKVGESQVQYQTTEGRINKRMRSEMTTTALMLERNRLKAVKAPIERKR